MSDEKKTKSKKSRVIYGTVTSPKDFSWSGTEEEMDMIADYLSGTSKSFQFLILGKENHESGKVHYHYVVKYKNAVLTGVLDTQREYFQNLSGSKADRIIFGTETGKSIGNLVGYCGKDDTYITRGGGVNYEGMVQKYRKKKHITSLAESEGISVDKAVIKDMEIINWLKSFMTSRGYKVNYHQRTLHGVEKKEFFVELNANGFSDLFGDYGLKLAEKHIEHDIYYDLPMWKPDMNIIGFSDCYWDMETGSVLPKEEDHTPVAAFDFPISMKNPKTFIKLIEQHNFVVEDFRRAYGRQFKKKVRRGKNLVLCGPPLSGKSTLLIPFVELFKDVIGEWASDGAFSIANIARYSIVYSEEVSPWDSKFDLNKLKKLHDGTMRRVQAKHKSAIEVTPKTIMYTTNELPPKYADCNYDYQAVFDRLEIYQTSKRIEAPTEEVELSLLEELPLIVVWVTRNQAHKKGRMLLKKKVPAYRPVLVFTE